MAETTETLYTVARGKDILTDLRRQVPAARGDLAAIEGAMRSAKLEPDVQLVTVTRTTTVSDPTPYVEEPVAVDEPVTPDAVPADKGDAEEAPTDEQAATTEPKKAGR